MDWNDYFDVGRLLKKHHDEILGVSITSNDHESVARSCFNLNLPKGVTTILVLVLVPFSEQKKFFHRKGFGDGGSFNP